VVGLWVGEGRERWSVGIIIYLLLLLLLLLFFLCSVGLLDCGRVMVVGCSSTGQEWVAGRSGVSCGGDIHREGGRYCSLGIVE